MSLNTSRTPNISPNLSFTAKDILKIKFGKKYVTVKTKLGDVFKIPCGGFPELLLHISNASAVYATLVTDSSIASYGGTFFSRFIHKNRSPYPRLGNECPNEDDDMEDDEDDDDDDMEDDEDDDDMEDDEDDDEDSDSDEDEDDWSEHDDEEFPIVSNEQKKVPINQIGLTPHLTTLLQSAGIKTLGDFYPRSRDLFLEVKGIGCATLEKLNAHLIARGYPAFYR